MAILEKFFGKNWREEKKEYRELRTRVRALPADYENTYKAIEKYCYNTGLINNDWRRFAELVELFEISAADGYLIKNIVGEDVAGFCDAFFANKGRTPSWLDRHRQALNEYFAQR